MTADAPAVPRVVWLHGPPCAGKSATAWELFAHPDRSGGAPRPRSHVDVDQLGMCYPAPADDPERSALKARGVGAVVRRHAAAGAREVVVSGVLERGAVDDVVAAVGAVGGAAVTFVRVRADAAVLRPRLQARYGPDAVERALAEAAADDDGAWAGGPVVDTSGATPAEAAREVREVLASTASTVSPPPATVPSPAPVRDTGPGRAVLLVGPPAVGASSVAFSLFLDLLGAGRTAAFLDLAQLSLLRGLPPGAPEPLAVAAAVVGDLWAGFQQVGAQDLVLTGRVGGGDDVQRCADTLGATPLLVVRLRAGRAALAERVAARVRGGGPLLAGDDLLGLDDDAAAAALEAAVRRGAALEREEVGDAVLDVDDLDPAAAAAAVRGLLDDPPARRAG